MLGGKSASFCMFAHAFGSLGVQALACMTGGFPTFTPSFGALAPR
jgi:hypothetical protein